MNFKSIYQTPLTLEYTISKPKFRHHHNECFNFFTDYLFSIFCIFNSRRLLKLTFDFLLHSRLWTETGEVLESKAWFSPHIFSLVQSPIWKVRIDWFRYHISYCFIISFDLLYRVYAIRVLIARFLRCKYHL